MCTITLSLAKRGEAIPGPYSSVMHATEGALSRFAERGEIGGDAVTDERVGVFTPDKDGYTHTSRGRIPVLAARRGTVCGEVGRVLRFPSTQHPHPSTPVRMLQVYGVPPRVHNHNHTIIVYYDYIDTDDTHIRIT